MSQFFQNGFGDSTKAKVWLYEKYLEEFLGVWVSHRLAANTPRQIDIYDFFCGPGQDSEGNAGSPLAAYRVIQRFGPVLRKSGQHIRLWLSDNDPASISLLKDLLSEPSQWPSNTRIEIHAMEFHDALAANNERLGRVPTLIFADQFGVKYITPEIFRYISSLKRTDLIFFISSSMFGRFYSHENFLQYHKDIGEYLEGTPSAHIHRSVKNYYQSLVPNTGYKLAPFSLKKGANIHGLIFGTGHIAGMRKFLDVAWKADTERGEANFDVDGDQLPQENAQISLIEDNRLPKKVDLFQADLENRILSGALKTDKDIHEFSVYNGFLPTVHAREVVKKLKQENKIDLKIRLGPSCCNDPRKITLLE